MSTALRDYLCCYLNCSRGPGNGHCPLHANVH